MMTAGAESADHYANPLMDSFARTDLWVNSQSTQEISSVRSLSTRKQGSSDLWFSKEEEASFLMPLGLENIWCSQEEDANFLASMGLGSIGAVSWSETCSTTSTLWPESPEPLQEAALLMEKEVGVEVGDKRGMSRISSSASIAMPNTTTDLGLQEVDNDITTLDATPSTLSLQEALFMEKQVKVEVEVGDKRGINRVSSSPSIAMPSNTSTDLGLQVKESSVSCCYDQELGDVIITVDLEEDSWSMVEDQTLRLAMANNILMQPLPWQRIAEALPWRTPLEVFNRTNQLLQTIQRDLSNVMMIFTTEQQQQQQVAVMAAPDMPSREQKQLQNQKQPRNRWSEEEHKQFLAGVERYGWGNWKMVATLLPGRTVAQVTSHAQRYQIQKQNPNPTSAKRRRRS